MRQYIPDYEQEYTEEIRHQGGQGVLLQRTKTVIAGDHLDADIYPVLDWQYRREAGRHGKTPEQMRKANLMRARRSLTQLLNANFGDGDLILTLTCAKDMAVEDFLRAKKRFFYQLRKIFRAAGVKLEYLGVIEVTNGGKRYHIHMVLRGGVIGRDEVEKLWTAGTANADRVQTRHEDHGLAGFCRYITQHKDTQEKLLKRRWFSSKGLKKPRATYNDSKFSRRAAAKLDQQTREDAKKLFEKKYPGWQLVDYTIHYSDFLPGVYVHAHMRRIT